MPFSDRADAGRKLAAALARFREQRPIIFALPRGGVVVAAEVAAALQMSLDLVLARKIGVPSQPELAMGAIADGAEPVTVRNEDVIRLCGISEREFQDVADRERAELERRRARYLGTRPAAAVAGRIAILIDDGVATGATTRAALRALRRRNPKRLVLAVPVAPVDTLSRLRREADEIVCLEEREDFGAIGCYYADFRQIADEEVIAVLDRFPPPATARRARGGNRPSNR
ncbi:MAG TPA: phosphoribosyltransferase family protein [Xanthobacteraceae bacterium]|nr:phosphoribosyltransferase family protein [Xanthobacteraceae bacterium]